MAKKLLRFPKDTFYNGELLFEAGSVHEVDEAKGWANRWIVRGAEEVTKEQIAEKVEQKQDKIVPPTPPVPPTEETEEDVEL